ncbi:MAG: hypothetical protein OJF51_002170 [Nitrospira sp.]|jgi:hypothetical protein|nr:MAG: hypothetical protein OJF51_002170 [Nitrospira sp.]
MEGPSPRNVRFYPGWLGSLFIFLPLTLTVTMGCATVITPLKPSAVTSVEAPDYGYVLGRVNLEWNGATQVTGQSPFTMKWRVTNEKSGAQLVINQVPVDGPFVLSLPAGSYQLTAVSFDNSLGEWRTPLPASFSVQPQKCTYLGTWDLTMQTRFFSGLLTRQVRDQQEQAEIDMRSIMGNRTWSPMVTQLGASVQSPLVLTAQIQGTQLTSPP